MSKFVAWTWLASIVITGAVFTFAPMPVIIWCIIATIVIEPAHQIAPIALAWSSGGFRELMVRQQVRYLLLPVSVFWLAVLLPLWLVAPVYWTWNSYHYGMQNYGTLSLYRRPQRPWLAKTGCLLVTTVPMLLLFWVPLLLKQPRPHWEWLFIFGAAMNFNHWAVDIALSGKVSQYRWWLIAGLLAVGSIGFIWYEPTVHGQWSFGVWHPPGIHRRNNDILQVAMAIGFVHFLYSGGLPWPWQWAWLRMGVWHLSDPQVRAAIMGGYVGR
jgi:hypothetical protein